MIHILLYNTCTTYNEQSFYHFQSMYGLIQHVDVTNIKQLHHDVHDMSGNRYFLFLFIHNDILSYIHFVL